MGLEYVAGQVLYGASLDNVKEAARNNFITSGCQVTQRAAGANMSVDVATGSVYLQNLPAGLSGLNLTVPTAHATLPRIDIVSVQLSGTTGSAIYAAGTAASSPNPAELAVDETLLARILVGSGVTQITNSNITDERIIRRANTQLQQIVYKEGTLANPVYPNIYLVDNGTFQTFMSGTFTTTVTSDVVVDAQWSMNYGADGAYDTRYNIIISGPNATASGTILKRQGSTPGINLAMERMFYMQKNITAGTCLWKIQALPFTNDLNFEGSGTAIVHVYANPTS